MDEITIFLLCLAAFSAGFVDAIVGGGGLIQMPAGLILLPYLPVSKVIGSLKVPAFSGTSVATFQYLKKVRLDLKLALLMMLIALVSAYAGSELLTHVSNAFMKPLLLAILVALAIYTFLKKDFGQYKPVTISKKKQYRVAVLISLIIGFYDGFIGPGTGSFLIIAFITLMGFDFLHASANAKLVNLSTNVGSIILFILKGQIIWAVALPMAASNAVGGWLGAKLAISKGNDFIRIFFLIVICGTILRFAYDVFFRS
ncbi:TSUP family transporter [Emticicia sp. CRIBPO]|uniref:TSUP family transporter n=1 Tax=Emticicia sp. CRIBPO TaxID=2683258 RepID=UPI001411FDB9|nr:TSUP family transporter [Emticicia sp. CRIBPO]NBA87438.1 TSUP family transporter [Emticicia sp. CRIBPO]